MLDNINNEQCSHCNLTIKGRNKKRESLARILFFVMVSSPEELSHNDSNFEFCKYRIESSEIYSRIKAYSLTTKS